MMKTNQKSLLMPLFACSILVAPAVQADEYPTGWYIGGELGRSGTDFDNNRLNNLATAAGLNITNSTIDDTANSRGLFLGYQFNEFLAVEGGYRDIGDFGSTITGTATDPAQFNQIASSLVPQSGDGGTLGIILSYPFAENWRLSGKIGMWNWENEIDVTASTNVANTSNSETDIYYGAEASYQISNRWQAYFSAVRYEFDRDESSNLSIGLRYFFDSDKKTESRAKPAPRRVTPVPASASQPETKTQVAPKDTDGDGIYDEKDQCANTPRNHQVDSKGCTLFEAVTYQHELVIEYPNNSSVIDSKYQGKIQKLVDFARDKGIKYMQIVGHTSAPGTEEYNQWLSEQRAKSLKTVLVEQYGFSGDQIETVGKGEREPIAQGDTEAAHSRNRRIKVNLSATGKNPKTK